MSKIARGQHDYLIIGQGLAGSILALHLLALNKRIMVLDNGHLSSSSLVAAGMINPIAGRRLAKSWKLDEALPYALSFYQHFARCTNKPCFFPRTIHRLYKNNEEAERLHLRIQDPAYTPYLGQLRAPCALPHTHADTLGSIDILQGGYLAVGDFLISARTYLQRQHSYQKTVFDNDLLDIGAEAVRYQNLTTKHVVFCEGWRGQANPWFNWLPFNSAKGDILTVHTKSSIPENIINQRKWILPINHNELKVGATYTRETLDNVPQPSARAELIVAFKSLLPNIHDYHLTAHQAGVRPLTIDNRPFVGRHPAHPRVACFNGFGSKGALFIPLLAQHFAQHLEHGTTLCSEADIQRFWQPARTRCN